ncbi:MAG: aminotransferase class I/II-fold pyridoxal phosphate-dependent enzyme [Burkholderiaceae bacterium]
MAALTHRAALAPVAMASQTTAFPSWVHGGPDAQGAAAFDFSTNANACGPCPQALAAVRRVDPARYPDPTYTALRAQLAQWHGVDADRIVVGTSASELIHRITQLAARQGVGVAQVPRHGFGEYARAARLQGLALADGDMPPHNGALLWACAPSSPLGQDAQGLCAGTAVPGTGWCIHDLAYAPFERPASPGAPFRWQGRPLAAPPGWWQLWSPNKALGLTGVRAAYLVAPAGAQAQAAQLDALAASWPVGAHGVALLQAWVQPEVQGWLCASLPRLTRWAQALEAWCLREGWALMPGGLAHYRVARPPVDDLGGLLACLRAQGVQLRDTASFGLPGGVRWSAQPPQAQAALARAWRAWPRRSALNLATSN